MKYKLYNKIKPTDPRTLLARKNIIISFFFKGSSLLLNLAIVPLTLDYLDKERYGIWLTISSIVGWLSFFDIGLGNGLRNKLAEAKATNDLQLSREYVSTTYATLTVISSILFVLFLIAYPFIDWSKALNVGTEARNEVGLLVLTAIGFYCIQFVLNLIGTVATADQKPAYTNAFNFSYTLISFIAILVIRKVTGSSLILLGFALSSIPPLILMIASVVLYKTYYKMYSPSYKYIKFKHVKNLAQLGVGFFIIQLSYIVIFSSSNILISQLLNSASVTPYNIAFKYFSIITMLYSIYSTPYWTAFTDAYVKKETEWIRSTMKKLTTMTLIISAILIIMVLLSKLVYELWVGKEIIIPYNLSMLIALYVFLYVFMQPYAYFLNGTNNIRLQMILSVSTALLNIPLTIFLTKTLDLGVNGIILGPIICLIPFVIALPNQYQKIMKYTVKRS